MGKPDIDNLLMIAAPTILTACFATLVAWVRKQELDPFHGRGVIAYGPYAHRRQIQVQASLIGLLGFLLPSSSSILLGFLAPGK